MFFSYFAKATSCATVTQIFPPLQPFAFLFVQWHVIFSTFFAFMASKVFFAMLAASFW